MGKAGSDPPRMASRSDRPYVDAMLRPAITRLHNLEANGVAAWLLLLSILAHALAPTASAIPTRLNSAFSPWTIEVSLAPTRPVAVDRQPTALARDDADRAGPAGSSTALLTRDTLLQSLRLTISSDRLFWMSPPRSLDARSSPFAARAPPIV